MPKTRSEFSARFERESALREASGRSLMRVAAEVRISRSMLRSTRAMIRSGKKRLRPVTPAASPLPSPTDRASEIARLKRELDRTLTGLNVLEEAISIFWAAETRVWNAVMGIRT